MVWVTVALAAASAIGAVVSANSASKQNAVQSDWSRYNAQTGYDTAMSNIASQTMIGMFNASVSKRTGEIEAGRQLQTATYNSKVIDMTTTYNNSLLEEEIRLMWEAEGLDQSILAQQRESERGNLLAFQSASGTTTGFGANKEAIISQMAQEKMDSFVIRHNADTKASKIANAMAQNVWQGNMQIQRTMWEGEMGAYVSRTNASNQSIGTLMNTMLASGANTASAQSQLVSGMAGSDMTQDQNQFQISQNMTQGLFNSASSAVSGYYQDKSFSENSLLIEENTWTNPDTGQPWS